MSIIMGQALRFLQVGGIATAMDASIFALLVTVGMDPRLATMTSYSLSAVLAFWLHRNWTFAAGDIAAGRQAFRFALLVGAGLCVSTAVVWALVPLLGPLPAKAVAIGATLILNFSLSRLLVFRRDGAAMD